MHKKLVRKIQDIPFLPAKSIFQIMGEDLEKRKNDLEKYFNVREINSNIFSNLLRSLLQDEMY